MEKERRSANVVNINYRRQWNRKIEKKCKRSKQWRSRRQSIMEWK